MSLSPEQLNEYREGLRQQLVRERQVLCQRQRRGVEVARQAAECLKARWGASRVILFGSMLDVTRVHGQSDIDLAVEGLPPADYWRALAELLDLDPDFSIDLVEMDRAKPHILPAIQAGVEL